MAAVGAVASLVGSVGSLASGGGSTTQYVPTYEAEQKANQFYLDYLSDSYDKQIDLINSEFQTTSDMTDINYKMYVQKLAADNAQQQDALYNSYLQSLANSYLTEQTLEMERVQEQYTNAANKLAVNMEYQNTLDSIDIARKGRELQADIQKQQYELGLENYGSQREQLDLQKELGEKQYAAKMSELDLQYDSLTQAEKELLLQQQASRDELTSNLASINKSEADNQIALNTALSQAEQQKQQLMLNFLQQTTSKVQGLADMQTKLAAQGIDMNEAVRNQTLIGTEAEQLQRQLAQGGISNKEQLAQASAQNTQSYLDTQRDLAESNYERSQEAYGLGQEGLQRQRQGLTIQGNSLADQQQYARDMYQQQMGQSFRDEQGFINNYYGNNVSSQMIPEMQAQLAERQATQGRNLNLGAAQYNDLMSDYYYDVDRLVLDASRQLDKSAYSSNRDLIDSQYNMNANSAIANYWASLGSNQVNKASAVSQLASGTSSQMYDVAASTHGSPQVGSRGGGSGANFGAIGKSIGQLASLFGGNSSSSNPTGYSTMVDSNYQVSGDFTPYASYAQQYTPDLSGGYSGFSGYSLFS